MEQKKIIKKQKPTNAELVSKNLEKIIFYSGVLFFIETLMWCVLDISILQNHLFLILYKIGRAHV